MAQRNGIYILTTITISLILHQLDTNGFVIQDMNNCENTDCGEGQECQMQQVQCVRAPCPPIPTCVNATTTPAPAQTCESVGPDYCPDGYYCQDAGPDCHASEGPTCVKEDPCLYVDCATGSHCAGGACVADPTCYNFMCGPGEECYLKYIECSGCRQDSSCTPIPCCRPVSSGCGTDYECENCGGCDCETHYDCECCNNGPVNPVDPVPGGVGCSCDDSVTPPPYPVGCADGGCGTDYDCGNGSC